VAPSWVSHKESHDHADKPALDLTSSSPPSQPSQPSTAPNATTTTTNGFFTPNHNNASLESISPWHTAPKTASCNGNDDDNNGNNIDGGSTDHFASLASNDAITPVKVVVTKLEVTKDD